MRFFVAKLSAAPAASTGAPFTSELRCIQYAALLLESPYVLTFVYRVYENTTGTVEGKIKWGGALCFEWGFTRTFPGNQDVAVK